MSEELKYGILDQLDELVDLINNLEKKLKENHLSHNELYLYCQLDALVKLMYKLVFEYKWYIGEVKNESN